MFTNAAVSDSETCHVEVLWTFVRFSFTSGNKKRL